MSGRTNATRPRVAPACSRVSLAGSAAPGSLIWHSSVMPDNEPVQQPPPQPPAPMPGPQPHEAEIIDLPARQIIKRNEDDVLTKIERRITGKDKKS